MRPLSPEDYKRYAVVTDPQISPDGLTVAYVVTQANTAEDIQESSIWMAALAGSAEPRCVVPAHSSAPRFSPDGQWLAYLAGRGPAQQLFVAPLAGGDARQVTFAPRAITQPVWSPDSALLVCVTRDGGRPVPGDEDPLAKNAGRVVRHLREAFDGTGWLDGTSRLVVVDLEGAARFVSDAHADADSPAWSPDGSEIAYVSDREPGARDRAYRGDLWVVAADGSGDARQLTASSGPVGHPCWSPDGVAIAYLGNDAADSMWAAPTEVRVVASDGAPIERLTMEWDRSAGMRGVLEGAQLAWTPHGDALLFAGVDRGFAGLWAVDRRRGAAVRPVVTGDRHVPALAVARDGSTIVFAERGIDRWPALHAASIDGTGERAVALPNAALAAEVELRPAERIVHVAADGIEIESFVIRPTDGTGAPKVLVDVHGGPHGWHPSPAARVWALQQIAAADGYVVVLPNPRGSLGYGAKFTEAVVRDWGGADFGDILGAVDAAIAATNADARQQYLWGYSYGGYMASWAVGHTDRFRSAVIGAPVGDLVSMALTSDITGFSIFENGHPLEDAELLRERSPITHLRNATTPSLVFVHDGDLRCPPSQAHEVFTALRLAGCKTELVRYPGGFHGVAAPSQVVDQIERSLAWFRDHS
ncbi:MAG TPA: S9 family peptidase [Acidimicrobiales bacterium]|nr:S9 family peptidase [Acidimicrobiales bacterium]